MNQIPTHIVSEIEHHIKSTIMALEPVSGGCINSTYKIMMSNNERYFLKYLLSSPPHFFNAEARGLTELAKSQSIRIPNIILQSTDFLLLEWIESGKKSPGYWKGFGYQLAKMHYVQSESFGFIRDNYCGKTLQINTQMADGFNFFRGNRMGFQMKRAYDNHLITLRDVHKIELFARKIEQFIPEQPASLIHGDLWSGNVLTDSKGFAVLIDPAVSYGWAEAELAMTMLFGMFPKEFYQEYTAHFHLEKGWEKRSDIYNVYHLLNHLNLFGSSYYSQVMSVVNRYI